jgi:hypothetical protein
MLINRYGVRYCAYQKRLDTCAGCMKSDFYNIMSWCNAMYLPLLQAVPCEFYTYPLFVFPGFIYQDADLLNPATVFPRCLKFGLITQEKPSKTIWQVTEQTKLGPNWTRKNWRGLKLNSFHLLILIWLDLDLENIILDIFNMTLF